MRKLIRLLSTALLMATVLTSLLPPIPVAAAAWVSESNPANDLVSMSEVVPYGGTYVVYMLSFSNTWFKRYDIQNNSYTTLATPITKGNITYLTMSPNGDKIAAANDPNDVTHRTHIQIYDVSANTWTESAVIPNLTFAALRECSAKGLVFGADSDTIWVYAQPTNGDTVGKYIKYTISTDSWTEYAGYISTSRYFSRGIAISSNLTSIYATDGQSTGAYILRYMIDTNTYTDLGQVGGGRSLASADHNARLWTVSASSTYDTNYLNVDTMAIVYDQFPEINSSAFSNRGGGFSSDGTRAMEMFSQSPPTLWSNDSGGGWLIAPDVTTNAATSVQAATANLSGNVTAVNDAHIDQRGFVWGTSSNGTNPGNVAPALTSYDSYWTETDAFGAGEFSHVISSLSTNMTYYFRACALNDSGLWAYGAELNFTTSQGIPSVDTWVATDVTETGATVSGNVTALGDAPYADKRGFVVGATSNSTNPGNVAPTSTSYDVYYEETGTFATGNFSTPITGLPQGTLRYFRAYAHAVGGYAYGDEFAFLTGLGAPTNVVITLVSSGSVSITWDKGLGSDNTTIRGKAGSYPIDIADGYSVYEGPGTSTTDNGLTGGQTYYYRLWGHKAAGGIEVWSANYAQGNVYVITVASMTVSTIDAHDISLTTALLGGSVSDTGGQNLGYIGFVWDSFSHGDPGDVAPDSTAYALYWFETGAFGAGSFSHLAEYLTPGTTYYFRSFGHNNYGWSYSAELSFKVWSEILWYQPNTVIQGTVLPDRTGGGNPGIITWGTNPANFNAPVTSPVETISSDVASNLPIGGSNMVPPYNPSPGNVTETGLGTDSGFYAIVDWIHTTTDVDAVLLWYVVAFMVAGFAGMIVCVAMLVITRGVLPIQYIFGATLLVMEIVLGTFSYGLGVIDHLVIVISALVGVGLFIAMQQLSTGGRGTYWG